MATSYAPDMILEVRHYLKPLTGLSDIELGIVNNETDASYHHGWSQRDTDGTDYSWDESSRDWSHKTNAARALDVGMFGQLREMSMWIVEQCRIGAADCADIREIIYSPDGVTVLRWDRLGKRSSGSKSHTTHTHFSWFADAEYRRKVGPFQRFFEEGNMGYEQADRDSATADTYRLDAILQMRDEAVYTPQWNGGVEVREPNKLQDTLLQILQKVSDGVVGVSEDHLRQIIREEIAKTRLS
jgi:hypothetical protein